MLIERLHGVEAAVTKLQTALSLQTWQAFGIKMMDQTGFSFPVVYSPSGTKTSSPNDHPGVHHNLFVRVLLTKPVLANRLTLQQEHLDYFKTRGDNFDIDYLSKMSAEELHDASAGMFIDDRPQEFQDDPAPCVLLQMLLKREARRLHPALCDKGIVSWCLPELEAPYIYMGMTAAPHHAVSPAKAIELCMDTLYKVAPAVGLSLDDLQCVHVGPLPHASEIVGMILPEYGGWARYRRVEDWPEKQHIASNLRNRLGEVLGCGHYVDKVEFKHWWRVRTQI